MRLDGVLFITNANLVPRFAFVFRPGLTAGTII